MKKNDKKENGIVLIVVVVIIALLSTLVVDFVYSTHINYEVSTNNTHDIQASFIAKSGVNVVRATLRNNNLEELANDASSLESDSVSSGEANDDWELAVSSFPVGDGFVSIVVKDERSKFNLNSLVNRSTNQIDFQVLTALNELFRFLEIDSDKSDLFVSSLINWLDSNVRNTQNDQDPNGATGSFYSTLEQPYSIKDGPIDSLDEIRLIHGMDDEFYNIVNPYLTVNTKDKKINLSTSPKIVIMAALKAAQVSAVENQGSNNTSDLDDDTVEQIADKFIEERIEDGILTRVEAQKYVKEIDSSINISAGLSGVVLNTGISRTFSIKSTGFINEVDSTFREVNAVVFKNGNGKTARMDIIAWKER